MRSQTSQVQTLSLDDERLAFRMLQAGVAVFAVLYLCYFVWFQSWAASWRLLGACFFAVGAEAYSRRTKNYRRALEGLSVALFLSFAVAALMQSGVFSPALPWTIALTAIPLLTGSLMVGLGLGAVLVGLLIALWVHGPSSWFGSSQLVGPPDLQMLVAWISASALLVPYIALVQVRLRDNHRRMQDQANHLQELNEAKTRFLSNISHEIRTPLTGVMSTASLLQRGGLNEAQTHRLLQAQESSAAMLMRLVSSLLEFSRLESGAVTVTSGPVDVHVTLEEVTAMFAAQAGLKGIELTSAWDHTAPQTLPLDRQALTQVLTNLVSNGVKFTSAGGVHLSYGWRDEGRSHVVFRVRDSGIGIDPSKHQVLFSAYRHADREVALAYGGTGLGLVISRELVQLMGGAISVESTPRHGSTFTVEFAVVGEQTLRTTALTDKSAVMLLCVGASLQEHVNCRLHELGHPLTALTHCSQVPSHRQGSVPGALLIDCDGGPVPTAEEVHGLLEESLSVALLVRPDAAIPGHLKHFPVLAKPVSVLMLRKWLQEPRSRAPGGPSTRKDLAKPLGSATAHAHSGAPKLPASVRPTGTCILLAEDNPINQVVTRAALEQAGMTVVVASEGEEAVRAFQQHRPDLVLMDLRMPGLSGLSASHAIRTMEAERGWGSTPIIASSANLAASEWPNCQAAGMNGYLAKPYTTEQLLSVVRTHLQVPHG